MKSRKLFWLNAIAFTTFLIVEANVTGCGQIDGLPTPPTPGSVPGLPPPSPNPPVGIVNDNDGFYVRHMTNSKYTYVSHKGNLTMTEPCVAVAGEKIDCFIEGQELDLYFHGVEMQYNIPSTMCSYFIVAPYYYFRLRAGQGATAWQVDTDAAGTVGQDLDDDGVCDVVGNTPTCQYNYSGGTNPGPNCCMGNYVLTTRSWDTATAGYASVVTLQSWGGKIGNCLSGPAMKTQTLNTAGFPIMPIFHVLGTGINNTYKVTGPIEYQKGTNVHVANYWDAADYTAATNFQPVAIYTDVIPSLGGRVSANPTYYFGCFDTAMEAISEINVYVRSWTKKAEFNDLVANPALYQVNGNEPAPWATTGYFDFFNWYSFGQNANTGASPSEGPGILAPYPGNTE